MRRLLILIPCLACAPALAGTWSNLWSTRDQQAQRLLDQHRAAEAAKLFTDPRRRAYAELAAGHYPQAAELLKPFNDADSQYNRGNALARAGQLQDALAAYDAALKQAPGSRDIQHNRDLVAQALKQPQKKNPPQQGDKQQGGSQKKNPSEQSQGNKEPSAQRNSSQGQQSQGNQSGEKSDNSQQASGAHGDHAGNSSQSSQGSGSSGTRPDAVGSQEAQSPATAGREQSDNGGSSSSSQSGSAEREAQRDAAAAAQVLAGQSASSSSGAGRAPELAQSQPGKAPVPTDALLPRKPPSEQSLALDQWLRRIPEDSGELLRRKFLIEHMIKQQQSQDSNP
jgi:Ca-activated chloride channel family protein